MYENKILIEISDHLLNLNNHICVLNFPLKEKGEEKIIYSVLLDADLIIKHNSLKRKNQQQFINQRSQVLHKYGCIYGVLVYFVSN